MSISVLIFITVLNVLEKTNEIHTSPIRLLSSSTIAYVEYSRKLTSNLKSINMSPNINFRVIKCFNQ